MPHERSLVIVSIPTNFKVLQLHRNITDLYVEVEARITEAIGSISDNENVALSTLAKDFDVPTQ